MGAQALPARADDVWQMEEAYWRYVEAGDVQSYRALWHEDFVGWPCDESEPMGKANIGDWVREIRDKHVKVSYKLHRKAVQYFGTTAVTHYAGSMVSEYPDGRIEGEGQRFKITHTWMKVDDRWQIIGGMCGPLEIPVE